VSDSGVVRREIFFAEGERELTNYLHVFELLLDRASGAHITLRELVQELSGLIAKTRWPIDIEGNVQRLESERRAVQIMTIHKSKGLEAPVVFIAGGLWAPLRGDEARVYHDGGHRLAWIGSPSPAVKPVIEREEREEDQRLFYVALTRAVGRLYLPCLVEDAATAKRVQPAAQPRPKPLRGPYSAVNRRVVELAAAKEAVLTVEDVSCDVVPPVREGARREAWEPPTALLGADDASAAYAALRSRHAGAMVTSYTRLRGERGGGRASWIEQIDELRSEKALDGVDEVPGTTLRAARASGVFLHEMLERVPLATFLASSGLDTWRGRRTSQRCSTRRSPPTVSTGGSDITPSDSYGRPTRPACRCPEATASRASRQRHAWCGKWISSIRSPSPTTRPSRTRPNRRRSASGEATYGGRSTSRSSTVGAPTSSTGRAIRSFRTRPTRSDTTSPPTTANK